MSCEDSWRREALTQKFLGWAVIGRGVEGTDAQVEGPRDDAAGWEGIWIDVELRVEGGTATDQRREDGREGRLRGRHHCNVGELDSRN